MNELSKETWEGDIMAGLLDTNLEEGRLSEEAALSGALVIQQVLRKENPKKFKEPVLTISLAEHRSNLLTAVRGDKVVGKGSGSIIDTLADEQLWELVRGSKSSRGARWLAHRQHNIWLENQKR